MQITLPKLSLDKFTDSYFKAAEDKQKGKKGEEEFFKKGEQRGHDMGAGGFAGMSVCVGGGCQCAHISRRRCSRQRSAWIAAVRHAYILCWSLLTSLAPCWPAS